MVDSAGECSRCCASLEELLIGYLDGIDASGDVAREEEEGEDGVEDEDNGEFGKTLERRRLHISGRRLANLER